MTDKKLFILLCILIFSFNSCTSIKNALTGKKAESSDEFLIYKKKPLVVPPDFNDMPSPKKAGKKEEKLSASNTSIEDLLNNYKKI